MTNTNIAALIADTLAALAIEELTETLTAESEADRLISEILEAA